MDLLFLLRRYCAGSNYSALLNTTYFTRGADSNSSVDLNSSTQLH